MAPQSRGYGVAPQSRGYGVTLQSRGYGVTPQSRGYGVCPAVKLHCFWKGDYKIHKVVSDCFVHYHPVGLSSPGH